MAQLEQQVIKLLPNIIPLSVNSSSQVKGWNVAKYVDRWLKDNVSSVVLEKLEKTGGGLYSFNKNNRKLLQFYLPNHPLIKQYLIFIKRIKPWDN